MTNSYVTDADTDAEMSLNKNAIKKQINVISGIQDDPSSLTLRVGGTQYDPSTLISRICDTTK